MQVEPPIKPSTRGVGSKPLPTPKSDFCQLADAAVVARSQGLAGTAGGRLAADSVSGVGEMVDVPACPVRQLPHQRQARSETTSGRLVQVLPDSSSRLFAPKNTPETVSSPRSRTNWLAEVVDFAALAR